MSLNISHIKTKLSFSPPGIRSPPCCFKLPSVQTRLINSFQNGWDIKELSLYATSSGSNVLLENLAWQIVTVCPRIQQRQQLCYERADRVKEYCREDRGAAGEGHGGLVKKPLLPDVHLNKELFPVAVYLFIFLTYSFFASSHTDRQKGLCSKHGQRNTTENVGLDLSKLSFFCGRIQSLSLPHHKSFNRLWHLCLNLN